MLVLRSLRAVARARRAASRCCCRRTLIRVVPSVNLVDPGLDGGSNMVTLVTLVGRGLVLAFAGFRLRLSRAARASSSLRRLSSRCASARASRFCSAAIARGLGVLRLGVRIGMGGRTR